MVSTISAKERDNAVITRTRAAYALLLSIIGMLTAALWTLAGKYNGLEDQITWIQRLIPGEVVPHGNEPYRRVMGAVNAWRLEAARLERAQRTISGLQDKLTAIIEAMPSTFYALAPTEERVAKMVAMWQKNAAVNLMLETRAEDYKKWADFADDYNRARLAELRYDIEGNLSGIKLPLWLDWRNVTSEMLDAGIDNVDVVEGRIMTVLPHENTTAKSLALLAEVSKLTPAALQTNRLPKNAIIRRADFADRYNREKWRVVWDYYSKLYPYSGEPPQWLPWRNVTEQMILDENKAGMPLG